jgi:hypothetical protein
MINMQTHKKNNYSSSFIKEVPFIQKPPFIKGPPQRQNTNYLSN